MKSTRPFHRIMPRSVQRSKQRIAALLLVCLLGFAAACSNNDDDDSTLIALLALLGTSSTDVSSCGGNNDNWDGTSEDITITTHTTSFKKFTPAADGTYTVTLTWTGTGDVDSLRLYVGSENTIMSTDPFNLGDYTLSDTGESTPATVTASVTSGSFRCIAVYARQCDSSSTGGTGDCAYTIKVN